MEDQLAELERRFAELGQRQKQAERRAGIIICFGLIAAVGALMLASVRSGSTQDAHGSPLGVAAMEHARRVRLQPVKAGAAHHRWFHLPRYLAAGKAKRRCSARYRWAGRITPSIVSDIQPGSKEAGKLFVAAEQRTLEHRLIP